MSDHSDSDSGSSSYSEAGRKSGSRSRSRSVSSNEGSPQRNAAGTPNSRQQRSRSRSSHGSSRSGSHSRGSRSRSASGSRGSRSPSRSPSQSRGSRSRSRGSGSRSRSGSRSGGSRSGSRTPPVNESPQHNGSVRSKSGSRTPSPERRQSTSRTPSRSRSRSVSVARSNRGSHHSGSRTASRSAGSVSPPALQVNANLSDDSDNEIGRRKTSRNPSDDEQAHSGAEDGDVDDLFGDAGDISDDDAPMATHNYDDVDEPKRAESEPKEEAPPETRIDAEIPKISTNLGRELHFVKLPNFLSIETRPFDAELYEDEIDEEDTIDEEGRARLKLKVENTIRWRTAFDREGNAIKESNAKMVKWSDGSMSLHLGSEIFDIYRQPLQGDHNHLFIRQGTGLQGQALFRTKLSFRPHSTDSFTHRKITMSLADRSQKASGVKVLTTVTNDPELQRTESLRRDEDRLKASQRRESKQKRVREKSSQRGLTRGYIEDDEEGSSILAIKAAMKKKAKDKSSIYSSDEEESDIETSPAKRIEMAKRGLEDSDEEENASDVERPRKKPKISSDSDSDGSKSSSHSRSSAGSSRSGKSRSSSRASSKSGSGSSSGSSRSGSGSSGGSGKSGSDSD